MLDDDQNTAEKHISIHAAISRMVARAPGTVTYSEKLHQEREARRKEKRKENRAIRRKLESLDSRFRPE